MKINPHPIFIIPLWFGKIKNQSISSRNLDNPAPVSGFDNPLAAVVLHDTVGGASQHDTGGGAPQYDRRPGVNINKMKEKDLICR